MLTRFLEEAGIFMGSKYNMGRNEESFFFQRINEWILFQKNVTWDNPYNLQFSNEFIDNQLERTIRRRLSSNATRTYFGGKFNPLGHNLLKYSNVWGWKDPKNTLTMDIWGRIFPDAKVLHIYRNPIDVAQSLKERESRIMEKFSLNARTRAIEMKLKNKPCYTQSIRIQNIEEGIQLWESYISKALEADKVFNNVFHISFEEFLEKPGAILKELAIFLNIQLDKMNIDSVISKIKVDKKYAFTDDPQLKEIYHKHKHNTLFRELNYSNII
jgi:hypothetical protein